MAHDATASVVQWRLQDEVLIVSIDNPPVNALGAAVRQGLVAAMEHAAQQPGILRTAEHALNLRMLADLDALQQRVQARNALARAVFFNRLGEIRDRSFEQQRYRGVSSFSVQ